MRFPNAKDIAKLPTLAKIAFMARCILRVDGLIKQDAPLLDEWEVSHRVITSLKEYAETGQWTGLVDYLFGSIDQLEVSETSFGLGSLSAINAMRHAVTGVKFLQAGDMTRTNQSFRDAVEAVRLTKIYGAVRGIKRDFEEILNASNRGRWNDQTCVSLDVFGPMWPRGYAKPEWAEHDEELEVYSPEKQPVKKKLTERKSSAKRTQKKKTTKAGPLPDQGVPSRVDESKQLQFEKQLDKKIGDAKEQLDRVIAETKKSVENDLSSVVENASHEMQAAAKSVREDVDETKDRLSRTFNKTEKTLRQMEADTKANVAKIEEAATLEIMKKESYKLWVARKRVHERAYRRHVKVLIITALIMGVLIVGGLPFYFMAFGAWSEIALWKYAQVVLLAAMAFGTLRFMARLTISHRVTAMDAEERAVLINTYLRLYHADQLDRADRGFLFGTLFRPSSTGLIKEEGPVLASAEVAKGVVGTIPITGKNPAGGERSRL